MVVDEDLVPPSRVARSRPSGLDAYEGEPNLNPGYLCLKNTFYCRT